ncbi:flagellar protein export ATPase FliI [Afipia carboxidovorans]|uniref:flagellar protein export ATPase FliI n=1 Tax=Afipia carboxidovorans TaxID=40137 RepID=UPI0030917ED4|nr:flagellar protein export ATPase FliI [Afipia carboxidovorans]
MKALAEQIGDIDGVNIYGRVVGVRGLMVEVAGPIHAMSVGARIVIETGGARTIPCEVIGFTGSNAVVMPFAGLEGVRRGCRAIIVNAASQVRPCAAWLGRVVNAMGEPIDGKGPLPQGSVPVSFRNLPPPAHARKRVGEPLDLGVRALNTFLTCCRGQRMGIFAGSGVGKSVLLSMLARNVDADISVIGLVGERGREVQEFLQDDLGEEGLARSVVVVATSDEPALMRRQAAYLTLAIAEYFRDQDQSVLCLMDSVTRFAMAQREIGLSAGEPPTAKGYTPTVFTELPKLLERAGPGLGEGTITGIFTVLVDGDDHNEPVADAVRGILDGHIVMERAIAERGRYPAINILKSVSRTMPKSADPDFLPVIMRGRQVMATYADMEELIRLGAYRAGSSPEVDEAIRLHEPLEDFLRQAKDEATGLASGYQQLQQILSSVETES